MSRSDRPARREPSFTVRDVIHVCYHQILLVDDDRHPAGAIPPTSNGLVETLDDCAFIWTGIHTGAVIVTVQAWDEPPDPPDLDPWDEVVEVPFEVRVGDLRLMVLMDDIPDTFPSLTPRRSGTYRLRVHARGRDIDIDGTAFEPFEEYLIQIWQSAPLPDKVFKATDRYGAERRLHATVGLSREDPSGPAPPLLPMQVKLVQQPLEIEAVANPADPHEF